MCECSYNYTVHLLFNGQTLDEESFELLSENIDNDTFNIASFPGAMFEPGITVQVILISTNLSMISSQTLVPGGM